MTFKLSEPYRQAVEPLLERLPIEDAMGDLVVEGSPDAELVRMCENVVADPAIAGNPALIAGLWLYIDDLDRSHAVSQNLQTPSGCYWHAIMHRREGDFGNCQYWYRRAGSHPAQHRIDLSGGPGGGGTDVGAFDPIDFVQRVEHAVSKGQRPADLIALQRLEWLTLFEWSAEH